MCWSIPGPACSVQIPNSRAAACYGVGILMTYQGDYAAAQSQLTESFLLFQQVGNSRMREELLGRMGALAREQGDAATALACFEEVPHSTGMGRQGTTVLQER